MHIAIDINHAIGNKTGLGYYVYNLVRHLSLCDKVNRYCLYYPGCWKSFESTRQSIRQSILSGQPNFKESILRVPRSLFRVLFERGPVPIELALDHIDVFHATGFSIPRLWRAKLVVTIYDLWPLLYPEQVDFNFRKVFEGFMQKAVKADRIIVISESTKRTLMQECSIRAEKMDVIYLGVTKSYRPIKEKEILERVRKRYSLPEKFILTVGLLVPRKNFERLVEAFALVKNRRKTFEHKLIIAGGKAWSYESICKKIENLGLQGEVHLIGYVAESDMPALYSAADIFVFPSFYEGFGLPPLEAMACGVPVVASNTSSIPEVLGNAAIFANPYNVCEWADAIERTIFDDGLKQELRQKGFERVRLFSWEKTASETLRVYQEVYRQ